MKIAIPTEGKRGMDEQVSPHFCRAPTYTLIDTVSGSVTVIDNTSDHMGGKGKPPELIAAHGVREVLCANLGPSALGMFSERGITVYLGAAGTVKEVLAQHDGKKLAAASDESVCRDGKHHHDPGHDAHHEQHHRH